MGIDLEQINAATELVVKAEQAVRYAHYITPLDAAAVRERFLAAWDAGDPANPQLTYLPAPAGAVDAIDAARAALPGDPYWRELLGREVDRAAAALRALVSRDPIDLNGYAHAQYGSPSAEAAAQAERYLADHPAGSAAQAPDWPAETAAEVMRAVLDRAGLAEWTVEVTAHMTARMSVLGSKRLLRVRQDGRFTEAEIRRLVVHEIGTHVLRSANGRRQPLRVLGHGVSGYMPTEEGLAVWHEQLLGVTDIDVMRRYALRVIACHTALTGDFVSVFRAVLPHTTVQEAYAMTLRIKRALVDTAEPGGFVKDHVYFAGALDVGAHLAGHPDDHELLLACKWPVTEIGTLRSWRDDGLLQPPVYSFATVTGLADEAIAQRLT